MNLGFSYIGLLYLLMLFIPNLFWTKHQPTGYEKYAPGKTGYWIRYFRSEKRMEDFYSSLLGIPVAGATLPVAAFLLLAVYGRNPFLAAAAVILGVGHIGIHAGHLGEIKKECA